MAQEAVWSAKQFEEWDEFIDEVVNVNGHELRIAKRNLDREDGDWVDPMFFAEDYTVAAATGFQVWEGARAVLKLLEEPDTPLSYHIKGKRILELGSGTGLAGLCASVTGGDVMLSDLPTVTQYSLRPNVIKNAGGDVMVSNREHHSSWPGARRVGQGFASCMPLDWTADLQTQAKAAGVDLANVQVVLAAECVWLKELVQPFVNTVLGIFEAARAGTRRTASQEQDGGTEAGEAICFCCYRDRAKDSSETFAGMAMVVQAFESSGCSVILESRLPPLEHASVGGGGGDILLYRIQLAK